MHAVNTNCPAPSFGQHTKRAGKPWYQSVLDKSCQGVVANKRLPKPIHCENMTPRTPAIVNDATPVTGSHTPTRCCGAGSGENLTEAPAHCERPKALHELSSASVIAGRLLNQTSSDGLSANRKQAHCSGAAALYLPYVTYVQLSVQDVQHSAMDDTLTKLAWPVLNDSFSTGA